MAVSALNGIYIQLYTVESMLLLVLIQSAPLPRLNRSKPMPTISPLKKYNASS